MLYYTTLGLLEALGGCAQPRPAFHLLNHDLHLRSIWLLDHLRCFRSLGSLATPGKQYRLRVHVSDPSPRRKKSYARLFLGKKYRPVLNGNTIGAQKSKSKSNLPLNSLGLQEGPKLHQGQQVGTHLYVSTLNPKP